MPKFHVTKELAMLLKLLRVQGEVSAKALASHIGRSPSYVSKLERGSISSIQGNELREILDYIVEGDDFFENKLPAVIRTLQSFIEPQEMMHQIWILYFDVVTRQIPVPSKVIEDIKRWMAELQLDTFELARIISENRDSTMSTAFPVNEPVEYVFRDYRLLLIRVSVEAEQIEAILEKRSSVLNFATIFGILFILFKLRRYNGDDLIAEQARGLLSETYHYLTAQDVRSLTDYGNILVTLDLPDEKQSLLSVFDSFNAELVDQIIACLHVAADFDKFNTAQMLEGFRNNLNWDLNFTLKVIGSPFSALGDMSFANKAQLLEDLEAVLETYQSIPAAQRSIETY
jgi:transcriptional regulator with XRE-family HTH domain